MSWNSLTFEERKHVLWAITIGLVEEIEKLLLSGETSFVGDSIVLTNGDLKTQAAMVRSTGVDQTRIMEIGASSVDGPVEPNIVIGVHLHKRPDNGDEMLCVLGVSAEGERQGYYMDVDRDERGMYVKASEVTKMPEGEDFGYVHAKVIAPFMEGRHKAQQEKVKSGMRRMAGDRVDRQQMPDNQFWFNIRK